MIEQFKSENEKLNQRIAALEAIEKEYLASQKNSEDVLSRAKNQKRLNPTYNQGLGHFCNSI